MIYPQDMSLRAEYTHLVPFIAARCGDALTLPTRLALDSIGYGIRRPDAQWNGGSALDKSGDIARRVVAVTVFILSLPYHLTLGLAGLGITALSGLDRRQFTLLKPEAGQEPERVDQIKVATFNTTLLPDIINGLKPDIEESSIFPISGGITRRTDRVAEALRELDADVVCLQEVFHPFAARRLSRLLADQYGYRVLNVAPGTLLQNSGLMVLSKLPIEDVQFERYTMHCGADSMAKKGALRVKINLGNGRRVNVTTTHLNSDAKLSATVQSSGDADKTRREQLALLRKHLIESDPQTPAIVLGDMNLWPEVKIAEHLGDDFQEKARGIDRIVLGRGCQAVGKMAVNELDTGEDPVSDHPLLSMTVKV